MLNEWKKGYDAGWDDNKMIINCPFTINSKKGIAWLRGFKNGNHDKEISLADIRGEFDETSDNL